MQRQGSFTPLRCFSEKDPRSVFFFWERTRQCGQTYASFVKKNKSDSSVSWSVSNTFEELNIILDLYKGFWLSRICLQKRLPRDWANWRTIFGLWESRPVKRWGRRQSTVSPDVNAKTQQYKYKYKAPCLPMLMWRHRNTSCPASGSFNNPPVAKIFIWHNLVNDHNWQDFESNSNEFSSWSLSYDRLSHTSTLYTGTESRTLGFGVKPYLNKSADTVKEIEHTFKIITDHHHHHCPHPLTTDHWQW